MRFAFKLALSLGCTVRELMSRLDSQELTLWYAYHGLDPWGEDMANWRAAMIACTMANCHDTKRAHKISEFMPRSEPVTQPWQKIQGYFMALAKR